jgi:HAD superfamily hydrolase (TIGR01450 family)
MRDFSTYLLDLDGVVYRGQELLPGARELVTWLDSTGRQTLFLSNNSFATPEEVAAKLAGLGIPSPDGRVFTAGWAAALAISEQFPGGRVFVLAVPSMEALAVRVGLRPVAMEEPEQPVPDAVLVGLDRGLTYARLRRAMRAILAGAAFYTVNRDPRLPVEDGFEPGTGSIAAALEWSTARTAEMIGKPAPGIVRQALRLAGAAPERALMVGDGLELDVVAGRRAGVATALVLTGLTSAEEAAKATGERAPEFIFPDLPALLAAARAAADTALRDA